MTAIGSFENIGVVKFRKEMQFDKEFRFMLIKRVSRFFVTVPLALIFHSYWALVAGIMTMHVTGVLLSYRMHSFRPRFDLSTAGELFRFSRWLLLNNMITLVIFRAADFVVGKFSGARALGLFSASYEISNLATTELVAPINRAVFPGYSKMADQLSVLRQGYLNVLSVIGLVSLPIGLGIAAIPDYIVGVFLGAKWLDAAPIIALLALYGTLNSLMTNAGSVINALGRPHLITLVGLFRVALLLPLLIIWTRSDGVIGAAWAYCAVSLATIPLTMSVVVPLIKLSLAEFFRALMRPLLASLVMYAVVRELVEHLGASGGSAQLILPMLLCVAAGAAVYTACATLLWLISGRPDGAETFMLKTVRARFAPATPPA